MIQSVETSKKVGAMLTTAEASERLGITPRHFARLRKKLGGIPGAVLIEGAWAFPPEAVETMARRISKGPQPFGALLEEDDDVIATEAAEMMRMGKEYMRLGLDAVTFSLEQAKSFAKIQEDSAKRSHDQLHDAEKNSIEAVTCLRDGIKQIGELEAAQIKADADQTVRLRQTRVAERGMNLVMPMVKSGLARWLGMKEHQLGGQAQTVTALVRDLKANPEKLDQVVGIFDEEQQKAIMDLVSFAEGHENLAKSIKVFKDRMTEEQKAKLGEVLDDKQIGAIASLFEFEDEEDDKKGPGVAKAKPREEQDEKTA